MKRPYRNLLLSQLSVLIFLFIGAHGIVAHATQNDLSESVEQAKAAGVPQSTLNDLLALGYEKGFDPNAMGGMIAVVAEAQRDAIPIQSLVSKINEGMLKGASPDAIEKAIRGKVDNYMTIRSMMADYAKRNGLEGPLPSDSLMRVTECLYCGLSREDVKRVTESSPPAAIPALTRALETLASLKQLRFNPVLSDKIVLSGIRRGFFTSERRDFSRTIALAKKKGLQDGEIASAALAAMESRDVSRELESRLGISSKELEGYGPRVGGSHSEPGAGGFGQRGPHESGHMDGMGGYGGGDGSGHGGGGGGRGGGRR
jgi:hypothetical protein